MPRPRRTSGVADTTIGLRLTAKERAQLDELVRRLEVATYSDAIRVLLQDVLRWGPPADLGRALALERARRSGPSASRPWKDTPPPWRRDEPEAFSVSDPAGYMAPEQLRAAVRRVQRLAAARLHPDRGGDGAELRRVNEAATTLLGLLEEVAV
jgi:Arc/MetJ-type ribon-helix-helix transcriptional regulator